MFVFWELSFRQIWASTSTSRRSVWRASTDYVNSAISGSHWTVNPRQHLCTPSWRHVFSTATLFMRCHRRRSPTGRKGWWTRLLKLSATLVSCKYDRGLKTVLHDEPHWLNVSERIEYKLGVMVYQCLHDRAPRYLAITLSQPLMLLLTVLVSDPLTWIISLFLAVELR